MKDTVSLVVNSRAGDVAAGEFGIRRFGLARVVCSINVADEMRARELKEAGFTEEGIHRDWYYDGRKWHDERCFSLVERELSA